MRILFALLLSLILAPAAFASSGAALESSGANVGNQASLQRGAKLFMNYCASCHSLKYMRYSRIAEDLGLSEEQVMRNFVFTGAKFGEPITVAMSTGDAEKWFGKAPPDLSLTARSRGPDWIYNYLRSFYIDEARATGWNNTLLPGASMPNVLWELQGIQRATLKAGEQGAEAHVEKLSVADNERGTMDKAGFDEAVRDITAFMQYVGEPAALQRAQVGVWVVLFLALLTFLSWLVKHEYWRDVH